MTAELRRRTRSTRRTPAGRPAALAACVAAVLVVALAAPATAAPATSSPLPVTDVLVDPCADTTTPPAADTARCFALERRAVVTDPRTGTVRRASASETAAAAAKDDYAAPVTPAQLQQVYGVAGLSAPAGSTVGIVVAHDAPNVESDLAVFRARYGLSECSTANGCFRKVDQRGATVPAGKATSSTVAPVYDAGWQLEITLDTQAVSAMCPSCRILLVEADDTSLMNSLGPAVAQAQALGATVVSDSFGGAESADEGPAESTYWSKATVPVFAAAGDTAHRDALGAGFYPAASPSVTTVGGTSVTLGSGDPATVTAETAWSTDAYGSGSGSGCSSLLARPSWQSAYFAATGQTPFAGDSGRCTTAATSPQVASRAYSDVAALADPFAPGFPVYLQGGWTVGGGTSLAAQLVAALAAYVGNRGTSSSTAQVAYRLAAAGAARGIVDVVGGSNRAPGDTCTTDRMCTAVAGWDGPTGLGTPRGLVMFAPLLTLGGIGSAPPGGTVAVTGANLLPGETARFTASSGGTPVQVGQLTTYSDGTYAGSVVLPAYASGPTTVTVTGLTSGLTASRTITVPTSAGLAAPLVAAAPGQTVTVAGTNFAAGESVAFKVGSGTAVRVTADGTGAASYGVAVPLTASGGVGVTATGRTSSRTASATVAVAAAALTTTATTVTGGDTVTVQGSGFGVGDAVQVSAPGVTPVAVTADGYGNFTAAVTVPVGTAATSSWTVTATASGGSGRSAGVAVAVSAPTTVALPATIAVGGTATLTGTSFGPGETVDVAVGAGSAQLTAPASVVADSAGGVSATVSVPAGACPVATTVTLTGRTTGRTASATTAVPFGAVLASGCSLPAGATLGSASGQYRLTLGADGNLALLTQQRTVWSTGTTAPAGTTPVLTMGPTGNLTLTAGSAKLWSSGTPSRGKSAFTVGDDGNLTVVTTRNVTTWSRGYAGTDVLFPGETLQAGWFLQSPDQAYRITLQPGGNLVETATSGGRVIWSSGSSGAVPTLTMTPDGDVRVLADGATVWSTNTAGRGVRLEVRANGTVAVVDAAGRVAWRRS